jgi:hypothetical protein
MNLIESPEAFEALDVVLAQIMSKDAAASTLALSQIDELIKDKEKVVLLAERIDQVRSLYSHDSKVGYKINKSFFIDFSQN